MGDTLDAKRPSLRKFGIIWIFGLLGLIVVLHLAKLDDTTVLLPDRSDILSNVFWAAGTFGFVSAAVGVWQSGQLSPLRRTIAALLFWLMGALASLGLIDTATNLALNARDFPVGKTRSFKEQFRISRAYRTHGRTTSWNIQTMPIWSNMEISEQDYEFMLGHRAPTDQGRDADEISSRGYFCAQVTVQEYGDALRIMHAGDLVLPKGTVIICPNASAGN